MVVGTVGDCGSVRNVCTCANASRHPRKRFRDVHVPALGSCRPLFKRQGIHQALSRSFRTANEWCAGIMCDCLRSAAAQKQVYQYMYCRTAEW